MPIPAAVGGALVGLPKLTAAGAGLLKTSIGLGGLGIGSAIGIPWLSDSLTRGAIEKYKRELQDGTEATVERTNSKGDIEMKVNPFVGLFVEEDKIDDRAKKELTRQIYSKNEKVQERAAALGLTEDDIGYNASAFLARTKEAFDEKKSLDEAYRELRAIPDSQDTLARLKEAKAKSSQVWQAVTDETEKRRTNPNIIGSEAYTANILEDTRDSANKFQQDSLGIQRQQLGDTRSIAEMGIIQSLIQNQQARIDNQENRNLQLQLRQFDREDRREDRLDRLDENRRKERLSMIQMLMRGLEGTARGFAGY